MEKYKYIYPPNAREQEQLDIMLRMEAEDKDPMAPEYIEQEILFQTKYWHISQNRFPYEGAEKHFLVVATGEVYRLEDISAEMWADLREVWIRLVREYGLDGGAMVFRFGNPAKSGASLTRVHCHIVEPRAEKKSAQRLAGGQN